MSKVVQWKRGNVTVNDTYTGANGEVTIDTTNWNLRVHDGVTAGGYTIDSSNGGGNIGGFTLNAGVITSNTVDITLVSTNGSIVSNSFFANNTFYVNTTNQLGYLFDTNTSGTTGLLHYNENGDTIIGINHDGIQVAKFYDNGTTVLVGNLDIRDDVNVAQSLPNVFMQITGNVDSYLQTSLQNLSTDTSASGDIVVTADNGSDSTYYIDMGIDGSNYSDPAFFGDVSTKNDGYLYVAGYDATGPSTGNVGNLILGSTNGLVKTFVGNIAQANVVTTASESGFTVNKGAFVVAANSAPAAANSTGTTGTIAWDSDYVYVCVATDTWKRANLSTW